MKILEGKERTLRREAGLEAASPIAVFQEHAQDQEGAKDCINNQNE
jgi:hypothetical protein